MKTRITVKMIDHAYGVADRAYEPIKDWFTKYNVDEHAFWTLDRIDHGGIPRIADAVVQAMEVLIDDVTEEVFEDLQALIAELEKQRTNAYRRLVA